MRGYELPTALEVGGRLYKIRSDYRPVLDILAAHGDPDLAPEEKALVTIRILYEDAKHIPITDLEEALKKALEFIDCGQKPDAGRKKPRVMDWEQDAMMIVAAVNKVAGVEVRAVPYMHWWTFFSYYMGVGDCLFSTVVDIRSKKAKGKKLEKHEREFYQENKAIVDLAPKVSEEAQEEITREKEVIMAFLDARKGVE